jgi:hypothetical protein
MPSQSHPPPDHGLIMSLISNRPMVWSETELALMKMYRLVWIHQQQPNIRVTRTALRVVHPAHESLTNKTHLILSTSVENKLHIHCHINQNIDSFHIHCALFLHLSATGRVERKIQQRTCCGTCLGIALGLRRVTRKLCKSKAIAVNRPWRPIGLRC